MTTQTRKVRATAGVGLATYPVDGHEYGDPLRVTDGAMYRNKVHGAAALSDLGARPSTGRQANGIDRNEEHRNETRPNQTYVGGEEVRSDT